MRLALVLVCLSLISQAVLAQGTNTAMQQPQANPQQSATAQPQDIELSCSDVALKLLLTNPEGIKFTPPPGPLGNSINKVVVFYPEAGPHNDQVVEEIVALLKLAREGKYVPPAQRQMQTSSPQNQPAQTPGSFPMGNSGATGGTGFQQPPTTPSRELSVMNGGTASSQFGLPNNSGNAGAGGLYPYPQQNPNGPAASTASSNTGGFSAGGFSAGGNPSFGLPSQGMPAQSSPDPNRFPAPSMPVRQSTDQFLNNPQSLNYPTTNPTTNQGMTPNYQPGGTGMVDIHRPLPNPNGLPEFGHTQPSVQAGNQSTGNLMVDQLLRQSQAMNDQLQYTNAKLNQLAQDNFNLRNERLAPQIATRDGLPGAAGTTLSGLPDPNDRTPFGDRIATGQQRPASLGQPMNIPGPEFSQRTDDARFMLLWLFLAGSIGLNIYLGMIARGLYVRYGDLADELRETFSTGG